MTLEGDGLTLELRASDRSLLEGAALGEPESLAEIAQRYAKHVSTRDRAVRKLNDGGTATQALEALGITRRTGAPSKYTPWQVRHVYRALTRSGAPFPLFPGEPPIERPVPLVAAVRLVARRFGFPNDVAAFRYLKDHRPPRAKQPADDRLRALHALDYRLPNETKLSEPDPAE